MASTTFDFPHPLGPTTAVTPGGNSIWVFSAKDLNPRTSILLIFMATPSLYLIKKIMISGYFMVKMALSY
jgi:hypothetical protein